MAACIGCSRRMRKVLHGGVEVAAICDHCKKEMRAAEKLTASCRHPGTIKRGNARICTGCGALKGDDGTWEAPMRRPRIRRVA